MIYNDIPLCSFINVHGIPIDFFCGMFAPFPVMGGKHGIVLPTEKQPSSTIMIVHYYPLFIIG
jgi:hypothetical protein